MKERFVDWQDSLQRGAFEEALGRLRVLELMDQGEPQAKFALEQVVEILIALRAKEYSNAKRVSTTSFEILNLEPDLFNTALDALIQAEKAHDKTLFEAAQEHVLTRAEACNQLGVFEALVGNYDKAHTQFKNALQADARHYRAITNLGNLELENGQFQAAECTYREALKLNPDYATAHNNLAAALRKQGKHAAGIAALKRSQRLQMQAVSKPTSNGFMTGFIHVPHLWANPRVRTIGLILVGLVIYLIARR